VDLLTRVFAVLAALLAGCAQTNHVSSARVEGYEVVARYAVGGAGGWDYPSVDEARHRLFISRGDRVQVVDTRTGQAVGEVAGTAGVHGVAFADDLGLGFTSNGRSDSVTVFDLETLAVVATVKVTGTNPDAILYEPVSKRIFTFNGRSANVTAIDAVSRKVVGTVAVSENRNSRPRTVAPGLRQYRRQECDRRHRCCHVESAPVLVARDLRGAHRSCDRRAQRPALLGVPQPEMVVVDAHRGKIIGELPIGASVDGAAFDPALDLAFSSNGRRHAHRREVRRIGSMRRREHRRHPEGRPHHRARFDHASHLPAHRVVYADAATPEQPKPRPTMVPDSFVILVLAPRRAS